MTAKMNRRTEIIQSLVEQYISHLSGLTGNGQRTYGFEYEFLPRHPFSPDDMNMVAGLLPDIGFSPDGDEFKSENGLRVNFEPGGQIEYNSPPLLAGEDKRFHSLLAAIDHTNSTIHRRLGIEYLGTGYLPGRADAPLCLSSDRYIKLHERLVKMDTRGLEMMKGTASIHLHVVISNFDELLPLFNVLCQLAISDEFKMSPQRRDIWDHTDRMRCGIPPCCFAKLEASEALIERLIQYSVDTEVLGENVSFDRSTDQSFKAFLYHMTTLFTDVRFNLKGPTLELRTLDSMPTDQFARKWKRFVDLLEKT
ncbi:MAG: glutamate-cysteine ligase family protein [Desulfosalsimonadaceae bacterium]|nr:glutamate-cysteine ligase family protein [Desulfosalsimonadaceae bacterium]